MKVTNKMIHKDVRLIGAILRPLTAKVTEEGYRKAHDSAIKKADKAVAKKSDMRKIFIGRPDGSSMRTVILTPKHACKNVPAVLFLHGGGYVLGTPEEKIDFMERLMGAADCVMAAPDYTLALDAPYPAAIDDAYLALLWLRDNAEQLGADRNRIFVVGESAGGGLAAALTIRARDRGEVKIAYQMPLFPMLDDRNETESAKDNDAPMWNCNSNALAWKLYLGKLSGSGDVPADAAPSRLTDFAGLPPAYSYVGTIEPFYDETRIYFEKLREAGVEAKLDVYPGGFHGFDELGKNTPLGKEARQNLYKAFRYAAEHYSAPQN